MSAPGWWTHRGRRAWRRRLVAGLVGWLTIKPSSQTITTAPERVVIIRPNHRLGNILMLTPLITAIEQRWPKAQVDLIAGGRVEAIFQSFSAVRARIDAPEPILKLPFDIAFRRSVRHQYDLAVLVDPSSQSAQLIARMIDAPITVIPQAHHNRHMALAPLAALDDHLDTPLPQPFPPMSLRLSSEEKARGKTQLMGQLRLAQAPTRLIGLYPFANKGRDYPIEWWQSLIAALHHAIPEACLVEVLPAHGQALLDGVDGTFLALELREFAAQLSALDAVIATDGGVMHLACAADTLTHGLFKVTEPEVYAPYGGGNWGWAWSDAQPQILAKTLQAALDNKRPRQNLD